MASTRSPASWIALTGFRIERSFFSASLSVFGARCTHSIAGDQTR